MENAASPPISSPSSANIATPKRGNLNIFINFAGNNRLYKYTDGGTLTKLSYG